MTIYEEMQKESYDLTPIFECLDGCSECIYSNNFKDYSTCKCNCHKDTNRVRLISDNERILGETAFAEEMWEEVENGGDPNVYL